MPFVLPSSFDTLALFLGAVLIVSGIAVGVGVTLRGGRINASPMGGAVLTAFGVGLIALAVVVRQAPTPPAPPSAPPTVAAPLTMAPPRQAALLYQSDWSKGPGDWALPPSGWTVSDGQLHSDGSQPVVTAPYTVAVPNYAVEVELQFVRYTKPGSFGLGVRGQGTNSYKAGFYAGARTALEQPILYCGESCALISFNTGSPGFGDPSTGVLAKKDPYGPPDQNWHLFRFEASGGQLTFLIDGSIVLTAADNRNLSGGRLQIFAPDTELNMRAYRVLQLP